MEEILFQFIYQILSPPIRGQLHKQMPYSLNNKMSLPVTCTDKQTNTSADVCQWLTNPLLSDLIHPLLLAGYLATIWWCAWSHLIIFHPTRRCRRLPLAHDRPSPSQSPLSQVIIIHVVNPPTQAEEFLHDSRARTEGERN